MLIRVGYNLQSDELMLKHEGIWACRLAAFKKVQICHHKIENTSSAKIR